MIGGQAEFSVTGHASKPMRRHVMDVHVATEAPGGDAQHIGVLYRARGRAR